MKKSMSNLAAAVFGMTLVGAAVAAPPPMGSIVSKTPITQIKPVPNLQLPKQGNGNGNGNALLKDIKPAVVKTLPANIQNQNLLKLTPKVIACKDYHIQCGKKFDFGFCYKGFDHCHWTYKCWWADSGCHCYWCPSVCCYYYWCVPDGCWYPISHCPYGVYVW